MSGSAVQRDRLASHTAVFQHHPNPASFDPPLTHTSAACSSIKHWCLRPRPTRKAKTRERVRLRLTGTFRQVRPRKNVGWGRGSLVWADHWMVRMKIHEHMTWQIDNNMHRLLFNFGYIRCCFSCHGLAPNQLQHIGLTFHWPDEYARQQKPTESTCFPHPLIWYGQLEVLH